ncbi:MauE/DoxX family redox-associated membrane protein [Mucilaginibacter polytrichastri]|uniref:Methylamine utilisation protein MauE domain-containing protein n=1 Tax=Mucilaginibacter polytrichastri TaxID=1302689 RepID=A0A1Q5ZVI2_9SPHI|nr:MauE/DoxX family redox-associated membrane protein [Mucilaginibacter polytrichastri]OKS85708.1 hypothetical protein RG47T_1154 [Mucilaginibacter polytrichastri]SFS61921.1 Methylamine utilisation protein MauE [Mucilaginibacter polytrichastri]
MLNRKIILEIITALLVLLFLYTAINKFLDFEGFASDMNNQPFPNELTPVLIWVVPSLELSIVAALLFNKTREAGLFGSLLLIGLFTLYTAMVMLNGFSYVPCSCGGVIKNLTWPQHLVFNLCFVAISFIGIRLNRKHYSIQTTSGHAT